MTLDPEYPLVASDSVRGLADVPMEAATAARFRMKDTAHHEIGGISLTFGGFAFRDKHGALLAVSAVQPLNVGCEVASRTLSIDSDGAQASAVTSQSKTVRKKHRIDFGPQEPMSESEAASIPGSRWDAVLAAHKHYARGARKVAWVMGYERLCGRMLSPSGGFAYALETTEGPEYMYMFFPLLSE